MNADDSIGVRLGQIMDEGVRLARSAWKAALLYVAVLTATGVMIDQLQDVNAGNLMFTVVSFTLGYVLCVSLLRDGGLAPDGLSGGFGSYFGLSFIAGFGMILGFLALVIPGLVLFVRWAPAYGYVLGQRAGVSEGLSKAWQATGVHFWPLALALLPAVGLNLAAASVYFLASDDDGIVALPMSVLANGVMSAAGAGITVIGIAAYALLRDRRAELAEVFA